MHKGPVAIFARRVHRGSTGFSTTRLSFFLLPLDALVNLLDVPLVQLVRGERQLALEAPEDGVLHDEAVEVLPVWPEVVNVLVVHVLQLVHQEQNLLGEALAAVRARLFLAQLRVLLQLLLRFEGRRANEARQQRVLHLVVLQQTALVLERLLARLAAPLGDVAVAAVVKVEDLLVISLVLLVEVVLEQVQFLEGRLADEAPVDPVYAIVVVVHLILCALGDAFGAVKDPFDVLQHFDLRFAATRRGCRRLRACFLDRLHVLLGAFWWQWGAENGQGRFRFLRVVSFSGNIKAIQIVQHLVVLVGFLVERFSAAVSHFVNILGVLDQSNTLVERPVTNTANE